MMQAPKPTLQFEDAGGGTAALEKPINVLVAEIKDGATVFGPEALGTTGLFIYRRLSNGASLEIWDDKDKEWKPDPGLAVESFKPTPLANKAGDPNPWQGIVVAAGGKDKAGQPQFGKVNGGYPNYSLRAWFTTKDGTQQALSAPSNNLTFVGVADKNLMVVGPGDEEKPDQATQSRLVLKNPGLQVIGQVLIERDTPGAKVTVQNAAGASVVLHPDGKIEITPGSGQKLVVSGDLEAGRISYLPSGGGARKELV